MNILFSTYIFEIKNILNISWSEKNRYSSHEINIKISFDDWIKVSINIIKILSLQGKEREHHLFPRNSSDAIEQWIVTWKFVGIYRCSTANQ